MDKMSAVLREAVRVARLSSLRTRVIAGTIGSATLLGVVFLPLSFACAALSMTTVIVARRSPRWERRATMAAWTRAGAGPFAKWAVGAVEALIVGWIAIAIGLVIGLTVVRFARSGNSKLGNQLAFAAAEWALVSIAACLPTTTERDHRSRSRARSTLTVAGVVVRAIVAAAAVFSAYSSATHVRTDLDLFFAGASVIVMLVVVGLIATGPAQRAGVGLALRISKTRPAGALARRSPARATVRLVVVAALTVAAAASVLGASVGARPETLHALDVELARLPALPSNVALVRLDTTDLDASLGPDLPSSIAENVRDAEVITLRHIVVPPSGCIDFTSGLINSPPCLADSVVVADPRLGDVYGTKPRLIHIGIIGRTSAGSALIEGSSRAPLDLQQSVHKSGRLPKYTFADAAFVEVPRAKVTETRLKTSVRSVFVRTPNALTRSELARLTQVVRSASTTSHERLRLIAPAGELFPRERRLEVGTSSPTLRSAPWAATSSSARWSIALIAGLTALVTLFVSLTIDAIDRRHDAWRLERLGATPAQLRGAAALGATILVAAAAWISLGLVTWLVRAGTLAFNRAEPRIPVPFTMPWPIVAFLTIGLPVLAGATAAAIALPIGRERIR